MKLSLILIALIVTTATQPALAQPGRGQGQGHGQGQGQGPVARGNQPAAPGNVVVADRDRNTVYTYYRNDFAAGNCPPGLAKKNNGCLPPGQARKFYRGQRYPSGYGTLYTYQRIPYDLRRRYRLNSRYRYYYSGGYIYVVDPRTMLIAQVISALLR